jgi:hypothetical protein
MEKNFFIVFLASLIAGLLYVLSLQSDRLDIADKYIKELENDFPEYIDTTSGSDAYSEYYKGL